MTTHPNTEQRKKLERYDIPGHAHELTFPCYHRFHYLNGEKRRSNGRLYLSIDKA